VFPIVLIGLALWFDIKLPRPTRLTATAASLAGILVLCVPFAFLYQRAPSTETWGVVLPDFLTRKLPGGVDDVQILIVVGTAIALLLFGILRPRLAVLLIPLALVGYFVAAETVVVHSVGKAAKDYRNAPSLGQDADWLDRAVPEGSTVALITGSTLGPDTDRIIGWETGFFNRTPFTWIAWGVNLNADPLTGSVTAIDGTPLQLPEYVITPSSAQFVGPVIADRGGFVLQQPTQPYRLAVSTSGVFADGWIGPTATIDVFVPDAASEISITLGRQALRFPATPAIATLSIGELALGPAGTIGAPAPAKTAQTPVTEATPTTTALPTPPKPFRVIITTDPTFSPAEFGSADTRQLAAQLTATFGPLRIGTP
jgi:hypothetical protein